MKTLRPSKKFIAIAIVLVLLAAGFIRFLGFVYVPPTIRIGNRTAYEIESLAVYFSRRPEAPYAYHAENIAPHSRVRDGLAVSQAPGDTSVHVRIQMHGRRETSHVLIGYVSGGWDFGGIRITLRENRDGEISLDMRYRQFGTRGRTQTVIP